METVVVLGFLLGTALGSFVKVLADRSLANRSFWGRSYCPHCQKHLRWYDLFPILSYILSQGRCRYCHKKIGQEYLLVELLMGVLMGVLFWQSFQGFQLPTTYYRLLTTLFYLLFNTFFIVILGVVFLTDFKKMLIYDRIIYPAIVIGFFASLFLTLLKIGYLYFYLAQTRVGQLLLPPYSDYFQRHAILAAQPFLGSVAMAVLIGLFFMGLIIVTKGKGMGGGDVKLGAFMGLMLGFPQALIALILSFLTGAMFSIILIISGKKHFGQVIPFGPFLVLGSLIALYWGDRILNWYLNLQV